MRVEEFSHLIHSVAEQSGPAAPAVDVLGRIEAFLKPYLDLTLEAFADLLAKVKRPKPPARPRGKSEAQKQAEAQKNEAKRVKAEEAVEAKRLKAEAADEAKRQKEAAKSRLADEKRAKAAAAAGEKSRLAKEKADKKAALPVLTSEEQQAAMAVAAGVQTLLNSFYGGGVPKAKVDAGLALLKPLGKPQLLHVAKMLDADTGLSARSSKPVITKAIHSLVMLVWKTSDNVNH